MALSNADFRSLLNQADASILAAATAPRKKKTAGGPPPAVDPEAAAQRKQEKSQKRRERYLEILKRKQKHKDGKASKAANDDEQGGESRGDGFQRYKDRAEERRKGKDELYQQVAEELQEMKERSIEESKYLGGDVEHTHLVKGLDFALLSKVRSELEKEAVKKQQAEQEGTADQRKAKKKMSFATALGRRVFHAQFETLHPLQARFSDHLKHLEMATVSGQKLHIQSETFQPGRLAYNFDLSTKKGDRGLKREEGDNAKGLLRDDNREDFMPTFIFRGADDPVAKKYEKKEEGCSTAVLLPKITLELQEALEWHRENRKKKKHERVARRPGSLKAVREVEERAAAAVAGRGNVQVADDDDIFGGVGGFDAQKALENAIAEKAQEDAARAEAGKTLPRLDIIRDEEGMEVEDDEQPGAPIVGQTTTEDQDRGFHSVFRRDEETMIKQRLQVLNDQREKDPAFVSDTYAECYPGFGSEVAYLGYDSDEEGDGKEKARVDTGEYRVIKGKNQQFKSKEEYEKYIGEVEFVPKAALQYGRRLAGEFGPGAKKKRKMNIDQEWKKIEGMLKEKKAKTANA
ncbi:RED family protein [Besnoitia besnoiti]|uniref:RED family protein n=1 Tax=Besnoitia besnoiti TaxID=94643 RepID=A0A2A9MJD8_BESBE|nr:RED family protein [Besnoitia besnoiti]PFH38085.1 RED family protein [Besnoitia besnoiti]